MSSSMETELLLSDVESGPRHWREVDLQKWEAKAAPCFAAVVSAVEPFCRCRVTDKECRYETCFGRYWGVM